MKIATRKSKLAQTQTEIVTAILENNYNIKSEKLLIETMGDKILDVKLDKIGGKGLFVKEIEMALIDKRADAAVHSMKDVPYELLDSLEITAILEREDPRDVFVASDNIEFKNLRKGARIGTSSNRRSEQLKLMRPDIEIIPIRGNVQTRIEKIEKERLDGIVLAAAGLKRLGMDRIITNYFEPDEIIPAIGQGALGIEMLKKSEFRDVISKLDNYESRICVEAERSFMRSLNGSCQSTIGAYAWIEKNKMHITGIYKAGDKLIKKNITGDIENYNELGTELAEKIKGSY